MIDVMVKRVGQELAVEAMEPELKAMQRAVGGRIEAVTLRCNLAMYVNEEGKLANLPVNFACRRLGDVILGDVFFMAHDDDGEARSLSDDDRDCIRAFMRETATLVAG